MRKRITPSAGEATSPSGEDWLDLEDVAEVEITSEDPAYPVESALIPAEPQAGGPQSPASRRSGCALPNRNRCTGSGWSSSSQMLSAPRSSCCAGPRMGGRTMHEVVRQHWNFSPQGSTQQTEDHPVELSGVTILELSIDPDIGGGRAHASLGELRIA